jgi:hypothetical protein
MADEGRTSASSASPGLPVNTPDLVAYWKFDDVGSYVVRDVTGHGHDLYMATKPRYEVVRWV